MEAISPPASLPPASPLRLPLPKERHYLVADNMPLIHAHINRAIRLHPCIQVLSREDRLSSALFGAVRAAQGWDATRGAFSTYLWYWVRQYLQRDAIREIQSRDRAMSLQLDLYGHEKDCMGRAPTWVDRSAADPSDRMKAGDSAEAARRTIERCLGLLTDGQRKVVVMRRFSGLSLRECSAILGVTKERVRQLEAAAMKNMREVLSDCGYHDTEAS